MSPVFAASRRRLLDLRKEWGRLGAGNRMLDVLRQLPGQDDEQKAWMINAAISSGISGLYTGMEEVLRGLLSVVDGFVPAGERSYQDLLDQASIAVEGVRPAMISPQVCDALIEPKGFRHLERHNYRFRFSSSLVDENEARAGQVGPDFIRDVEAFIDAMSSPPDAAPGTRL